VKNQELNVQVMQVVGSIKKKSMLYNWYPEEEWNYNCFSVACKERDNRS